MGFAAGVRAGSDLVGNVYADQRAREQEARTAEKFGWEKTDRTRTEEQRALEDKYWADRRANEPPPQAGLAVPPAAAPAVDAAQGATGMRAGTAQGLPTQPAGAPQPAAPVTAATAAGAVTGTATAPTPVEQATPSAAGAPAAPAQPQLGRDQLDARSFQQLANIRRDPHAYNVARQQEREADIRDTTTSVMQMKDEDINKALNGLNTNVSNYPLLVTSKGKGGYEFLTVSNDGEPGKKIKLSAPQVRQVVLAHELSNRGYGAEALQMLNGVSKDLGESFKAHTEAQYKATTASNTAQHYAQTGEEAQRHNQAVEGISREHLNIARDKAVADKDKAALDRFQTGKYWSDNEGNTYITVPRTGKQGVDIEAFQVGGDGSMKKVESLPKGLKQVGGGGSGGAKDWKTLPEHGTVEYNPNDPTQRRQVAPGGYIAEGAPQPNQRVASLKKMGWSEGAANAVEWSGDGMMIKVGDEAMRWDDPRAAAAAKKQAISEQEGKEQEKRINAPLTEPPLPWYERRVPYSGAPTNEFGEATGNPGIQYAPYLGYQRFR